MLETPTLLFVDCTNTWASPIAAAAFRLFAQRLGLTIQVSSVGLSREYAGEPVSADTATFARQHGLDLDAHRARQLRLHDLRNFTYIIALDQESLTTLRAMRPDGLSLIDDHADFHIANFVCDPLTGEPDDVSIAWDLISSAVRNLAVELATSIYAPPIVAGRDRVAPLI